MRCDLLFSGVYIICFEMSVFLCVLLRLDSCFRFLLGSTKLWCKLDFCSWAFSACWWPSYYIVNSLLLSIWGVPASKSLILLLTLLRRLDSYLRWVCWSSQLLLFCDNVSVETARAPASSWASYFICCCFYSEDVIILSEPCFYCLWLPFVWLLVAAPVFAANFLLFKLFFLRSFVGWGKPCFSSSSGALGIVASFMPIVGPFCPKFSKF